MKDIIVAYILSLENQSKDTKTTMELFEVQEKIRHFREFIDFAGDYIKGLNE